MIFKLVIIIIISIIKKKLFITVIYRRSINFSICIEDNIIISESTSIEDLWCLINLGWLRSSLALQKVIPILNEVN